MLEKAACTIITKNYLAYARALAKSLSDHNPDVSLYVLLADRVDGYFDPLLEPFEIIYLEDLADQKAVEKMCFYYTPFELCCALRGLLHKYMFDQEIAKKWLFLDSDIMVFSSLEPIFDQLESASILLTPHSSKPVDDKNIDLYERNFLKSGLYNAGFLGLTRVDEAKIFIDWFKSRLEFHCIDDRPSGLFVDQKWLDLAPIYFKSVGLYAHPGANLGYWNLIERNLDKDTSGHITANNEMVLFVHFSGWDIDNPHLVTKHPSTHQNKVLPLWPGMANRYRDLLLQNGYALFKGYPYAFNYFNDGSLILPEMRKIYHKIILTGEQLEGSPFSNQIYFKNYINKRFSFVKKVLKKMRP